MKEDDSNMTICPEGRADSLYIAEMSPPKFLASGVLCFRVLTLSLKRILLAGSYAYCAEILLKDLHTIILSAHPDKRGEQV